MLKKISYLRILYSFTFLILILFIVTSFGHLAHNQTKVNLLYFFVFLVYLSIILYVIDKYKLHEVFKNPNIVWLFAFCTVLGNLFVYVYITSEKDIKAWDSAGYWKGCLYFSYLVASDVKSSIYYLYDTIENDLYSAVPCFFSAASLNFIGKEFVKYTITIYDLFIVPFYFVFILLIAKVLKNNNLQPQKTLIPIIIITFTFLSIIGPALSGYLDAIGLLYIGLLMILIYEDALSQKDWLSVLLTLFLIIILDFTRRWYTFWSVSFFLTYYLVGIIRLITDKSYTKKNIIWLTINLGTVGLAYILILYKFFHKYFERSLFNNYSDIYSAYKWGSYFDNVKAFVFYFGLITIALALLGVYTGIKNRTSRSLSLFLFIQLILVFYLFMLVQSFGMQHYYLLAPGILYFTAVGIAQVYVLVKWGKFLVYLLVVTLFLNLTHAITFWPPFFGGQQGIGYLMSQSTFPVKSRPDVKQIEAIVEYTKSLSHGNDKKNVYVIASSFINEDVFRNVYLPYEMDSYNGNLCPHHCQVDKRDGFPVELLSADIVMVADPVQYHLSPEDQRVVGIPAEEILSGKGIGKAYKFLKEFQLMNNVKLNIYEKINAYSLDAIDSIATIFKNYYPNYPNLYSFDFYQAIIYDKKITDGYSSISFYNNCHSAYMHPGDSAATSFKMGLEGKFSKVNIKTLFKDPDQIKKSCGDNGGEVFFRIYVDGILKIDNYQTYKDTINIELPLKGAQELKIELDKAKKQAFCDGFIIDNLELIK